MLIDWFTVAAQIVNFVLLVWLLKRFLWERLVRAIDDHEQRIAHRLAEADEKNKEAERQVEEMRSRAAEMERVRLETMAQAQREADERRHELVQEAREGVQKLEARWHQDLEREQAAFLAEVRRRAATEILTIVRRALADLACTDVQHCAVEVFLEKLQTVEVATLRDLASGDITVQSATELPEETQRRIQSVLEARLQTPVHAQFKRAPAMAWGLELRSNGRRIGWTSDSYLESLEDKLREALEHRPRVPVG